MTPYRIEIEPGAYPEPHELKTARTLVKYGTVRFLKPHRIQGSRTPDILWLNKKWEIKSPKGKGHWNLERTLKTAAKQSPHIIIDLHRSKIPQEKSLRQISAKLPHIPNIKTLKVITKKQRIIDFPLKK